MKRLTTILWLLIAFYSASFTQINLINGELRYQHQYQDALSGDLLYTSLRQSPMVVLGASGYVYAPTILSIDLQTSLNVNYYSTSSGIFSYSSKQLLFDYYNLNLSALQNYIVKFDFNARDGALETTSDIASLRSELSNYRRQQQRLTLSTSRLSFLPTTNVMYLRTHQWSVTDRNPLDQIQNEYSVNLSTSAMNSSLSLSAIANDDLEKFTGRRNRYYRILLNGRREFTQQQQVDFTAEYYKYQNSITTSTNASYSGIFDEKFRLNSNVFGRDLSGPFYQSVNAGFNQGIQYLQNENFNYFLNFNGQFGSDVIESGDEKIKNLTHEWGSSAAIQHIRSIGLLNFTNSLTSSYKQQKLNDIRRNFTTGISNSFQLRVVDFQVSANQGISYGKLFDGQHSEQINNYVNLSAAGPLPYDVHSQTNVEYRDEHNTGEVVLIHNVRTIQFQELLNTSGYYIIPYTISGGGSIVWYLVGPIGKTYGWNITFSSNSFFLRGLSLIYRLNRTFDPYFMKVTLEQIAEFRYQWRALSFELRVQEYRLIDRRREIWFSVSRPFNLGL